MDGLAFVSAHTVARRLAYPGTLGFLQSQPALDEGRRKLVEEMNGQRFKLQTRTGNHIDSMFVDRRNEDPFSNGNILIITCEGNAGFYEDGSATTPLEAGYSVLMWNHPGFGCSTGGVPWPLEETAAIDVVVQFALNELGWNENDIVIYGWSIGGFTASWAAMNYENIRGLILDATFDDIAQLAIPMPQSWAPIVGRTLRKCFKFLEPVADRTVLKYFNLRIDKQLAEYRGPVSVIRRSEDEFMAVGDTAELMRRHNRANDSPKGLLVDRYPRIFQTTVVEIVDEWLAASDEKRVDAFSKVGLAENWQSECRDALAEYVMEQANDENREYPLLIGADYDSDARNRMALYLASSHLVEFDSSHNVRLPTDKFSIPKQPWEVIFDLDDSETIMFDDDARRFL